MNIETILVPIRQETLAALLANGASSHESVDEKIIRLISESQANTHEEPTIQDSWSQENSHLSKYRIDLLGESYGVSSLKEVLVSVLGILADLNPNFLQQFSLRGGRTRPFVANYPEAIHPGKHNLVRYTAEVRHGWWVGTNYSKVDVARILIAACDLSGITFGTDLKVTF